MRSNEFAPLDDIIMKKIPGNDLVAVEAQRQAIRDKYAQMQIEIDNAVDIEELTSIIERYQSNENN